MLQQKSDIPLQKECGAKEYLYLSKCPHLSVKLCLWGENSRSSFDVCYQKDCKIIHNGLMRNFAHQKRSQHLLYPRFQSSTEKVLCPENNSSAVMISQKADKNKKKAF